MGLSETNVAKSPFVLVSRPICVGEIKTESIIIPENALAAFWPE
jgi:hypothetical protein